MSLHRTTGPHVVVVGDALLDRVWSGSADRLCPDSAGPVIDVGREIAGPGGAALTAAAVAVLGSRRGAVRTTLVTALGDDEAGRLLRAMMASAGVDVVDVGLAGPTPEKIRIRTAGITVARLDRRCVPVAAIGTIHDEALGCIATADAVLLSDYGRGMVAALPTDSMPAEVPVVWDPHPSSTRPHVRITLATPNAREARAALAVPAGSSAPQAPDEIATALARQWECAIALTCGVEGAVLSESGPALWIPAVPADGDPCGAGDWFAAGTTVALATGTTTGDALAIGCRAASRWVARRHPALPVHHPLAPGADAAAPGFSGAGAVGAGEVVVATSGCFDVLHVGHLSMLRHARSLGDRLVVLVNSDDSVRRLKGPGRPINDELDRVALLEGLDCVDEVRVFDELTPCDTLRDLRPDVFVKGADYAGRALPEAEVLAAWGGRIELAPFVSGRSTTRVLRVARTLAS